MIVEELILLLSSCDMKAPVKFKFFNCDETEIVDVYKCEDELDVVYLSN